MNHTTRILPAFVAFLLLGCQQQATEDSVSEDATLSVTETSRDFGDYVVHFNAISTDQLSAEVARQYGIVRSNSRGMLNVTILQKQTGAVGTPVSGSVSASAVNLNGQLRNLTMREIREEVAVYYIGEVPIANAETLIFTIDVTPINESSRFTVRYRKQFFVD
jgi:hypothetical protein